MEVFIIFVFGVVFIFVFLTSTTTRLLMQIHDELILEGPEGSSEEALQIVLDVMENVSRGEGGWNGFFLLFCFRSFDFGSLFICFCF